MLQLSSSDLQQTVLERSSDSHLLSESSPRTQAGLWVFRLMFRMWLSLSESRLQPAPITWVGGRPLCLQAT